MTAISTDIRKITGRIGAEIVGLDPSGGDLGAAQVAFLTDALHEHKALVFRNVRLDDEGQQRFARHFGELTKAHPTVPAVDGAPTVLPVDSEEGRANHWHTDVTFVLNPPKASTLRSLVVPPYGGETLIANAAAAYRDLPEPLRAFADTLRAVHTNDYDYVQPPETVGEKERERRAQFVSRADDSGTHAVERDSWSRAGVAPRGDWYIEARRGMSGTLGLADAWNAYTLADRGTYVAWRRRTSLSVLLDGERSLRKIYCVLEANAGNGPNVDPVAGNAFAEFILSEEAQDVIRAFGRTTYGEPLFAAAAGLEDSDVTGSD